MLNPEPFKNAHGAITQSDRHRDCDRPFRVNEALSEFGRDIEIVGYKLKLVTSLVKRRIVVDVHRGEHN
jgi:hypothetical protein